MAKRVCRGQISAGEVMDMSVRWLVQAQQSGALSAKSFLQSCSRLRNDKEEIENRFYAPLSTARQACAAF